MTAAERKGRAAGGQEGAAGILGIAVVFFASAMVITFAMLFATGLAQRQILPRMKARTQQVAPVEEVTAEEEVAAALAGEEPPAEAPKATRRPEVREWSRTVIDSLRTLKEQIRMGQEALDARMAEVSAEADRLKRERTIADQAADTRLSEMAKLFAGMKPQAAAQVMARLDDKTFRQVFEKLNKRQAAKIMFYIDPARVARLTKQMSVSATGK